MTDTQETQATALPAGEAENAHPLDNVIASIRAATAPDAPPEARSLGATACRSILTALEAQAGQLLAAAPAAATSPATSPTPPTLPIAGLLAQLASMPRDKMFELLKQLATSPSSPLGGILAQLADMPRAQLVELINKQLRALAPAGAPIQPPAGPRFHLIPVPQHRRGGGP